MKRYVNYRPMIKNSETDLSKLNIYIGENDPLFVFTFNDSIYKEKMTSFIGKMAALSSSKAINLSFLSEVSLKGMGIDILYIFSINLTDQIDQQVFEIDEGSIVKYIEISVISFIRLMEEKPSLFYVWNKHSLYILRDGSYRDMKYILSQVGEYGINLGRGGSQKAQLLSPLDFRLSSYLIAMYRADYKEISSSNMFNKLQKKNYLPYLEVKRKK